MIILIYYQKSSRNKMSISQLIEAKSTELGVHPDILKTAIALLLSLLLSKFI